PVPRNRWEAGRVLRNREDYGGWAAAVAREENALFIDLNELVARHYEELGPDTVRARYFRAEDHTHTTPAGAEATARLLAEALSRESDLPLARWVRLPNGSTGPGGPSESGL
ncbi:MAG: hypothetical protein WHT82_01240, partial [Limisphaera sp.]